MAGSSALEPYLLFSAIWFVAAATPGIDTMLLLTSTIERGWRAAIAYSIGITLAKVLLMTVAFFGLNAFIAAAPQLIEALQWFGAAFLLYKAVSLWNAKAAAKRKLSSGFWPSMTLAFALAVSNPTALLFYVAVVPQVSATTNLVILNLIIAVGFTLISAFYIGLAAPIRAWMGRGANQRLLNRSIAIIFVALAVVVILR
jgi:threonine/homoserine/homoserine lactone efflux protein